MKGDQRGSRAAYPTPPELPLSNQTWFSCDQPGEGAPLPGLLLQVPSLRSEQALRQLCFRARLCAGGCLYFLRASFAPPTAFCTLPLAWSILPAVCIFKSPVILPAASL